MTLNELHKWRRLASYVILTTCILPYFWLTSQNLGRAKILSELIGPALALMGAFFYIGFGLGRWMWKREMHGHVGKQIRSSLMAMVPPDLGVTEEERRALDGEAFKELTGLFWEAVGQSNTLVSQKEHFYSNGFVYSTSIDVFLICGFAGLSYWAACLMTRNALFAYVGGFFVLISILSLLIVLPLARARHMTLSAQQLDLMRREQRDFIGARFRQTILEWRRERIFPKG